jgi:hypothetical protein
MSLPLKSICLLVHDQSESDESEFEEEIVLGDEDEFGGIFQGEGDELLMEDPEEDLLSVKTDQARIFLLIFIGINCRKRKQCHLVHRRLATITKE